MGLGGARGRPRVLGVLMTLAAVLLSLAARVQAEGTSDKHPMPPTYLPVVCVRPLGSRPIDNPACSSPSPVAAIFGVAFVDTNENGRYEPEEDTVEGYQVHLQHADWAEPLAALPSGGYYCFEGLEPGDYAITVTLSVEDQRVLEPLDGGSDGISLQASEAIAHDFRYARWYQPPPGPSHTLHLPIAAR